MLFGEVMSKTVIYALTGDGEIAQGVVYQIMDIITKYPEISSNDTRLQRLREELKSARYMDWRIEIRGSMIGVKQNDLSDNSDC